jgi:ribosomal-protein-serine acetyltransferase
MFRYSIGIEEELRILEVRHAAQFLQFVRENREFLSRWLTWGKSIDSHDAAEAFLARGVTRLAEHGLPWVSIWSQGRLAGGVLFSPLDPLTKSTDVGYWLAAWAGGRGLASRAVAAMIDYAFSQVGVNRIGLQAEVGNERSEALAKRLGFTHEGTRREAWLADGKYVDLISYSLLFREWKTSKWVEYKKV